MFCSKAARKDNNEGLNSNVLLVRLFVRVLNICACARTCQRMCVPSLIEAFPGMYVGTLLRKEPQLMSCCLVSSFQKLVGHVMPFSRFSCGDAHAAA